MMSQSSVCWNVKCIRRNRWPRSGLCPPASHTRSETDWLRLPDGGTLTISLEADNGNAHIRFKDTGIGLTEDELKQLFVPFNSSFRNGTGLGLPIVYQIISAHNGTIAVRSRKGMGTTFVIDL